MPSKTKTTPAGEPPLPPGLERKIRQIVREIVTTENDIDLTIPDSEIERVAAKVIEPLAARVAKLEAAGKPVAIATTTAAARVIVKPKAARLDALRTSAARTKTNPKAGEGKQ